MTIFSFNQNQEHKRIHKKINSLSRRFTYWRRQSTKRTRGNCLIFGPHESYTLKATRCSYIFYQCIEAFQPRSWTHPPCCEPGKLEIFSDECQEHHRMCWETQLTEINTLVNVSYIELTSIQNKLDELITSRGEQSAVRWLNPTISPKKTVTHWNLSAACWRLDN